MERVVEIVVSIRKDLFKWSDTVNLICLVFEDIMLGATDKGTEV